VVLFCLIAKKLLFLVPVAVRILLGLVSHEFGLLCVER
jgi:hypothetical protein